MNLRRGNKVSWSWGPGESNGQGEEVYRHEVAGKSIARVDARHNPALFLEQQQGKPLLKLASELEN